MEPVKREGIREEVRRSTEKDSERGSTRTPPDCEGGGREGTFRVRLTGDVRACLSFVGRSARRQGEREVELLGCVARPRINVRIRYRDRRSEG